MPSVAMPGRSWSISTPDGRLGIDVAPMGFDASTVALGEAVVRYALERIRLDPPPLDRPRPEIRSAGGRRA